MAPEHDVQKRVGRKLTKKRKPVRASSVQYPERLRVGDDAHEDVTAATDKPAQYMNQSLFSMIAAAGSKTDFHARFEGEGSDSEDDQEISTLPLTIEEQVATASTEEHLEKEDEEAVVKAKSARRQSKSAERRGLRPLPKLKLSTAREKNYMSQSILLPPKESLSLRESPKGVTPRDAPVMGKMLEAQAELSPAAQSSGINEGAPENLGLAEGKGGPASLATRLKEIFGFERPEEVISGVSNSRKATLWNFVDKFVEYPCWLLQSVLLQGYLYITQKHICFFGYLPKKSVSCISRLLQQPTLMWN